MNRVAFVLRVAPENKAAFLNEGKALWGEITAALDDLGMTNFSVWSICDFMFCYGEAPDETAPDRITAAVEAVAGKLSDVCSVLALPGTMRLMYHDIGIVRADKSLIRHRVFATHLKPGCADEYKARHDRLVAARGDKVSEGPESNFTIWCADGEYNFGYCELVKAFDHEMTEAERESTIAWETKQLEIMDWYTDDVDWMTGEKHDHVALVCQYK